MRGRPRYRLRRAAGCAPLRGLAERHEVREAWGWSRKQPLFSNHQQTVHDQAVHQLEIAVHARRHLPARAAGHVAGWLGAAVRTHAQLARAIAWIDLHTGLGPNGHGERIFACRDDKQAYARANAWWGTPANPVTSIYDGSSSSAFLTGLNWRAIYEECPSAEYTGIALEYGTQPLLDVMAALRGDHWLHNHPDAPAELAAAIRTAMRDAFYTDTDAWRGQIISQARQAMFQAVDGLS